MKKMAVIGIIFAVLLILAYFIKFNVGHGSNYIIKSSLLGILIFYNPFILAIYILIIIFLIFKGIKK